jgi:hypothetical protein
MAPAPKQVAAVQKVLYERTRLRKIADHVHSIGVLMNLDPNGPSPGPGHPAGSGPLWYIPDTGRISPAVLEAAERCRKLAELLLEIRTELAHVDLPSSDKKHLRAALAAQAAAMRARGKVWRAQSPPGDVHAAVAPIAAHGATSVRELTHVAHYLKKVDLSTLR